MYLFESQNFKLAANGRFDALLSLFYFVYYYWQLVLSKLYMKLDIKLNQINQTLQQAPAPEGVFKIDWIKSLRISRSSSALSSST